MAPLYILRFDDVCPTMRWNSWNQVETVLQERGIRPILAVIPANSDPSFNYSEPATDFWARIRDWQAQGWTIGLHGYRHMYVSNQRGLCGTDSRSEFAGVGRSEQRRKLEAGIEVFHDNGVAVDAFIAPNHSFDETTVELVSEMDIPMINDGFGLRPHDDEYGTLWIPCQLNRYVKKRSGVWTVHYHTNYWDGRGLRSFLADLEQMADQITDVATITDDYRDRPRSRSDVLYEHYRLARSTLSQRASRRTGSDRPRLAADQITDVADFDHATT